MTKTKISRRTLLKGIAAGGATVAIGLPTLDIFCNDHGTALAQGSPFPTRFGVWIWGNGNIPERWTPRTTGRNYELSTQLSPLLAVRDDVTVITGTVAASVERNPHIDGPASFLAGTPITAQREILAPTVDVLVRNAIGGSTTFRSIQAGVEPDLGNSTLSVNGPGSKNPATVDPLTLYRAVFGADFVLPGDAPVIDPMWQLRRSALSSVMGESAALRQRLGTYDQRRLDEHLDGIRDLEVRLLRFEEDPPNLAACGAARVPLEAYPEVDSRPQMRERHRIVADLLTMALACDRTRVVHTMFSRGVGSARYPGVSEEHHALSHKIDPASQDQLDTIMKQIIGEFAYFVQSLGSVQEGDGRLLDRVALLATSETGYGAEHAINEYPILVAGSAGGRLVTGEHLRREGELASRVCFSLLRAVGAGVERFGANEGEATSGLPGLEREV